MDKTFVLVRACSISRTSLELGATLRKVKVAHDFWSENIFAPERNYIYEFTIQKGKGTDAKLRYPLYLIFILIIENIFSQFFLCLNLLKKNLRLLLLQVLQITLKVVVGG